MLEKFKSMTASQTIDEVLSYFVKLNFVSSLFLQFLESKM